MHLLHSVCGAFEELIKGNTITRCIDEYVIFEKLKRNSNALWSLLVATGYLKIVSYRKYRFAFEGKDVLIGGREKKML